MKLQSFVELKSPLLIGSKLTTGNAMHSTERIPGSTLRGAVAQAYLDCYGSDCCVSDPLFREIFLDGGVRFGDHRLADVWPRSVRVCKGRKKTKHAPIDLLLRAGAGKELLLERCPEPGVECLERLVHPKGGWDNQAEDGYVEMELKRVRQAHTSMDPMLQRARSETLFTKTSLSGSQSLRGFVEIVSGNPEIQTRLEGLGELWIGKGRSRGMGSSVWSFSGGLDQDESKEVEAMAGRMAGIQHCAPVELQEMVLFSITLQSPAIILDEWLQYQGHFGAAELDGQLTGYKPLAQFADMTAVDGWNESAGLPKSREWAIDIGSCFLFGRQISNTDERAAETQRVAQTLARVERDGIGERREEGFGEVRICQQIHMDLAY